MDAPAKQHLLGVADDELAAFCLEHDQAGYRARQVLEWVYRRGAESFETMTNLSKPFRALLDEHWVIYTSQIVRRQDSKDGTSKLLLAWPDAATSECVLIPDEDRRTACISSQVGCPVGCQFCASGLAGLERQLSTGEIVEQAMRVRQLCGQEDQRLSNIVFMGLGEPLANYANVLKAIRIINADWGLNIGARKVTVSTVGLPSQIARLADEELQINLALSLHAPNDELRLELIPWAEKISIDELVPAVRHYFERTGREVTIEYILLSGVNDRPEDARELAALCRRMRCNVNLIRYNPVAGLPYKRPTSEASQQFLAILRERGINAHLRKSRGRDIDAACGQLRRAASTESSH